MIGESLSLRAAIELDSNGTALLTRSAVTNKNRNPDLSERKLKNISDLGVSNFIWLDGVPNLDITDFILMDLLNSIINLPL